MTDILNKSPSLNQGNKFDKYQHKIKKALERKSKLLELEGFENMDDLDLTHNGLTEQTNKVIDQNIISNQESTNLNSLREEYNKTLSEYESLLNQISGNASNYVNRTSPSNPYLNKTVGFSTGQIGYVTAQGIFKYIPSTAIQKSVNIPTTVTPLNIQWDNSYKTPGTQLPTNPPLVSGTPVQSGQSFGNEGSNIYVDEFLPTDVNPTYMGCYATNSSNNNMTFIGGAPPSQNSTSIQIQNGNFSQPQIANNSYQAITGYNGVIGWSATNNAFLSNNSTAWGYPMPYPNGNQCVSLKNTGSISQVVSLSTGITYTLTFYGCGVSPTSNPINVQLYTTNNAYISTISNVTPLVNSWQKYTVSFTVPTSQSYNLTFSGTSSSGQVASAIQNIQLLSSGSSSSGGNLYI